MLPQCLWCQCIRLRDRNRKCSSLRAFSGLEHIPGLESSTALSRLLELPSLLPGVWKEDAEVEVCYDKEVKRSWDRVTYTPPWLKTSGQITVGACAEQQYVSCPVTNGDSCSTCFHGPVVESPFSSRGDSTDKRSGRMSMATGSAFQTCKYAIRSTGKSSLQTFNGQNI